MYKPLTWGSLKCRVRLSRSRVRLPLAVGHGLAREGPGQCFSSLHVHRHHLEGLLKHRANVPGSVGLRFRGPKNMHF